jgi:hypothetical protein
VVQSTTFGNSIENENPDVEMGIFIINDAVSCVVWNGEL